MPVKQAASAQQRRAAIDAMRELARQNQLGDVKIKDLIGEGRR